MQTNPEIKFDMLSYSLAIGGKWIPYTEKSVFRVEESRNAKCTYEGVFAHKDPVNAIRYYNSTCQSVRKAGFRVRLVKDGDEFTILLKKTF
jgi:hypothetical protein